MPSAPEAMKNKSTNKWISNHKGKKNKEPLNYVRKTGLSEQFLCFWAFCVCDNPKCILGNTSVAGSLISLDLSSFIHCSFPDQARCKKASVGRFCVRHCWLCSMHRSPRASRVWASNIELRTPRCCWVMPWWQELNGMMIFSFNFLILQRSHLDVLEIAS